MVWGQWLEWKDLVGHSSGGGSQKKRAARRGRVALQETWGKIGHGPGGEDGGGLGMVVGEEGTDWPHQWRQWRLEEE